MMALLFAETGRAPSGMSRDFRPSRHDARYTPDMRLPFRGFMLMSSVYILLLVYYNPALKNHLGNEKGVESP